MGCICEPAGLDNGRYTGKATWQAVSKRLGNPHLLLDAFQVEAADAQHILHAHPRPLRPHHLVETGTLCLKNGRRGSRKDRTRAPVRQTQSILASFSAPHSHGSAQILVLLLQAELTRPLSRC